MTQVEYIAFVSINKFPNIGWIPVSPSYFLFGHSNDEGVALCLEECLRMWIYFACHTDGCVAIIPTHHTHTY